MNGERTGWAVIDLDGNPAQVVWNSTDGAYSEAEETGWRRIARVRLTVESEPLDTGVGMIALRRAALDPPR